ncbi:MAG: S8 family serine peptidase [Pseudomonadota bacterium]
MMHLKTGVTTLLAALAAGCFGSAMAAPATSRVIVAYKDGGAAKIRQAVSAGGGALKLEIADTNAMVVDMPTAALAGLARHPSVDYIEADARRYPMALTSPSAAPYVSGQLVPYGIHMVQADQLPDTFAANRMVCIIDSGYDLAHEDLAANQVTGEYDKEKQGTGWWYNDDNHHGTHVAGTIAAINNAGVGVVGVLPNKKIKLHIVKVFSAEGWAYSSSLASAAKLCGKAGANVISMSLGGAEPTRTELQTFQNLQAQGVLSVAAAGNAGDSSISYPAGYPSVMMVGALDENMAWASFSQFNAKVELAGPGVSVLSTVPMNTGAAASLSVGAASYAAAAMSGSPRTTASAALADFGIGDTPDAAMAGKVCLILRGAITFAAKVSNCQASGGVGAVIYNNVPEMLYGTLGATVTTIPSVGVAGTDGAALLASLGQAATVAVTPASYEFYNGTSMATPHVSAVAALVWSYFPSCTSEQIRSSLRKSALDLGVAGRDDKYGYGLVQAKAAKDRIAAVGCGN